MKKRLFGVISALGLAAFGLAAVGGTPAAHAATAPTTTLGTYQTSEDSSGNYIPISAAKSPNVAPTYLQWGQQWPANFVSQAEAAGATPFIEIEPWETGPNWTGAPPSFPNIAANGDSADSDCTLDGENYDTNCSTWLSDIGSDIAGLNKPVIVTFAHEFNVGQQYPWSYEDTGSCGSTSCTPTQWIAAWDEVHSIINATDNGNAYWMWVPNADTGGGSPQSTTTNPTPYWPGANEVDMVGVDGYPQEGDYTFSEEFGATFSDIKALPGESTIAQPKIFIAETNLSPLDTAPYETVTAWINNLFSAGGDGVLEWQVSPAPTMTSTQWTELNNALAANTSTGSSCSYTAAPGTAPDPVTAATSGGNTLTVTWPVVGGSTQYEVDVTGPSGGLKADSTVTTDKAVYSIATVGTNGYVKVRAQNCFGSGPWSASKTWSFSS